MYDDQDGKPFTASNILPDTCRGSTHHSHKQPKLIGTTCLTSGNARFCGICCYSLQDRAFSCQTAILLHRPSFDAAVSDHTEQGCSQAASETVDEYQISKCVWSGLPAIDNSLFANHLPGPSSTETAEAPLADEGSKDADVQAEADWKDDGSLPLDGQGQLPFYLVDAHEEHSNPDALYLFGKVRVLQSLLGFPIP